MKITDIKITPPLGQQNRNWVLLKVFTDEGIVGLGEGRGASVGRLKKILIGQNPMNINKLHYDHLWGMQGAGAGVEIAASSSPARPALIAAAAASAAAIPESIALWLPLMRGRFTRPAEQPSSAPPGKADFGIDW